MVVCRNVLARSDDVSMKYHLKNIGIRKRISRGLRCGVVEPQHGDLIGQGDAVPGFLLDFPTYRLTGRFACLDPPTGKNVPGFCVGQA